MDSDDHTVVVTSPCSECEGTGERVEVIGGQQAVSAGGGPLRCKRCDGTSRIRRSVTLAEFRSLMDLS